MKPPARLIGLAALPWAMLLVAASAPLPAQAASAAGTIPVVTSNTVLADFVQNVGGDKVQVRALAVAGTDPHTFQPTPNSIRLLSQARVVFFNGSGLEEWWDKTLKSVATGALRVVELSRGLASLQLPGQSRQARDPEPDPHVWLDPILAKVYVERIRDALSQVDPANAVFYADRTRAYHEKLEELDAWIRTEVEKVPAARRKIVTFHDAFQYFARRYGFTIKGYVVASPGKEPSAKALAELTRRIKQEQIPAVFAEADFSAKLLELLAKDAGVKVVTNLYDGSLSNGPPADSYLNLMRHNATMIVDGLK